MFNMSVGLFGKNTQSLLQKTQKAPLPKLIEKELTEKAIEISPKALIKETKAPVKPKTTTPTPSLMPLAIKTPTKSNSKDKEIDKNIDFLLNKLKDKFTFPVTRIENTETPAPIAKKLEKEIKETKEIEIDDLTRAITSKSSGGQPIKPPTSTLPPSPPPPSRTTAKYDIFTMDSSIGFVYDLDKDGINETTHHDGVTAGLRMSVPNAQVIPKLVDLSSSTAINDALKEGIRLAQGVNLQTGESKIDAAYFPLGVMVTPDALGQMVGMTGLNFVLDPADPLYSSSLNNPVVNKTVRDKLMLSASVSDITKQQISAFEEMAKNIPVYMSAGNDPSKFNLWSLAQGANMKIIGSESTYSSLVCDKKVATDAWWTVWNTDANNDGILEKGWDIDGNGVLDRVLKAGDEGYNLAAGSKSYIYGGTSLGVGIALGKDILNNLVIDRELSTTV